jgi:hypothetical protein
MNLSQFFSANLASAKNRHTPTGHLSSLGNSLLGAVVLLTAPMMHYWVNALGRRKSSPT